MFRQAPITLFDATAAGTTLANLLFPGTNTCTLPSAGSNQVAPILNGSGATIGGVYAPRASVPAILIDFAGVGAADVTVAVEFGLIQASGALAQPFASDSLKSITTAGTVANVNPYTGEATASVTWRLFDLSTITGAQQQGQLFNLIGGTENDQPVQLQMDVSRATWYYIMITNISTITRLGCYITPTAFTYVP
jgi:hypothetical protein